MSLSPPFDHFRDAVFPARLSARQEADGEQRYAWTEQRIDEEGKLADADAPRSGTVEEDYAVGLNGVILDIPSEADEQPRVWLRLRGFHQESGRPVYEFCLTPGSGAIGWWARLTGSTGTLVRYWGYVEVEFDEDSGAWITLDDGRSADPTVADPNAAVCTSTQYHIAEASGDPMPVVWMTRETGNRPAFQFARIYVRPGDIGWGYGGNRVALWPLLAWSVDYTVRSEAGASLGTLEDGTIVVRARYASPDNPGILSTDDQTLIGQKTWISNQFFETPENAGFGTGLRLTPTSTGATLAFRSGGSIYASIECTAADGMKITGLSAITVGTLSINTVPCVSSGTVTLMKDGGGTVTLGVTHGFVTVLSSSA